MHTLRGVEQHGAARPVSGRGLLRAAPVVLVLSVLQGSGLVLVAAATSDPWVALSASVLVVVVASAVWARLRRLPVRRWAGLVVAILCLSAVAYLLPRPAPEVAGSTGTVLRLADGDVLALRRRGPTDASASPQATVVAVHGGPGVQFLPVEELLLSSLADLRAVVSYDQVGVGASTRLADPDGYTSRRSLEDLGEVVAATGPRPVVLLGHSWGARTALAYAARHPSRVDALVLTSPGPFPWRGRPEPVVAPQTRLSLRDRIGLYAAASRPRNLFVYGLTVADPDVAHWFAGDAEMDSRFAGLYRRAAPGTTCSGRTELPRSSLGYFAAQVPQLHPDGTGVTRDELVPLRRIPTLVVRGSCDYVPAEVAATYRDELGGALVAIDHAGHSIAVERPVELRTVLRSFLDQVAGPGSTRGRSR